MLVLARKTDESIVIGDDIVITVLEIRGEFVRLGVAAPIEIPVHRHEIKEKLDREREERLREVGG